jgi:mRNA-degrading endonuclease RelE of RelBE toxin-antitoxin system
MKKNRQTIRFTDDQIKKLRKLSDEKNKTISALLREMVQKS